MMYVRKCQNAEGPTGVTGHNEFSVVVSDLIGSKCFYVGQRVILRVLSCPVILQCYDTVGWVI